MSSPSPSEEPKTEETKSNSTTPPDFGWNLNQTLNQLIGFADFKAGALLAAAAVIIAVILQSKPTLSLFDILALVCLALCALSAGWAFLPFLPFRRRGKKKNPVYWNWIQHLSKKAYQKCVDELDNSEVNKYYVLENHEISTDLWWRFVLVQCSIAFLIVGLVFAALYFLTLSK